MKTEEDDYTVTPGTYDAVNYVRTDKLVIVKVTAGDAGDYTCKAAYINGKTETSVAQSLKVLGL